MKLMKFILRLKVLMHSLVYLSSTFDVSDEWQEFEISFDQFKKMAT